MSAAISSAVRILGNLLIKKVEFLGEVSGKVRLLIDQLNMIQSFLKDANNKKAQDERVRTWMLDIREVAHDAVDAIEMYVHNVESNKISKGVVGSITSFPKNTYYRNKVGNKIKSILARLDGIEKSRKMYGIKPLEEASESELQSQVDQLRRLPAWQKGEHLVGTEEDVPKLLREFVLNEENNTLAIGFLKGPGGIGKTTLAREVYNHPDVINAPNPFECRVWVVVSGEFTPQETIKQLIFELQKSEEDKRKLLEEIKTLEESMKDKKYVLQKLKEMLYGQLEGKSYLIVLDDVWEKEHLASLITAFPSHQDKRCRLLVTSRNLITTNSDQYVHEMKVLDLVKSKELLLKKANISVANENLLEGLESEVTQILEKCGGLPLAISVVGGLLTGRRSSDEWQEVLDQINPSLVSADSNVSAILELSYQYLSHRLKPCFLCLAFYKEDAIIPAKWLEDMWISECLIYHEGDRTVDEIARGYLNELINRSLIQIEDLSFDNRVKNCRIHDLVLAVCLRKANEEINLEIVKGEVEASSSVTPFKARHRVVYGNNLEVSKRNKHVRSLFLVNIDYEDDYATTAPNDFWKSFKLVKTLHLEGFEFRRFPDSLQLLTGLKTLRLIHTRGAYFLELPIWLNKFKNLEVLTVENANVEIFNFALNIEKLRHLEAFCSRGSKLESCKKLETLKSVGIEDWVGYSSTAMANCPLRELKIRMYLEVSEWGDMSSRVRGSWDKMTNLVELHLEFIGTDLPLKEVIPQLNSLTTLGVTDLMSPICTPASMFPPNLSHLILDDCDVSDDQLIELGKLPKLRYLALIKYKINDNDLKRMAVSHGHFPSLQVLYLQYMWELESIDIEQGGMPRLKQLKVHGCSVLQTQNLPQRIIISEVPLLVF